MVFRGRTVLAFIALAIAASVWATMVFGDRVGQRGDYAANGQPPPVLTATNNGGAADARPGLTDAEIVKLDTAYRIIESKYVGEIGREALLDGAIRGMLDTLEDPYSVYLDMRQAGEFEEEVDPSFTGIGAVVALEDGKIVVVSPIKGSPAELAGVRPRDTLLSVNGEPLDGLSLTEAVQKIRGPKGTQAILAITRDGQQKPIELIVVRDEIDFETVFSEMLADGIGKIEIRQFTSQTAASFNEQLEDLEKSGMRSLIIDVRNNPGGYLVAVVEILNTLIPEGEIVLQSEYRGQEREVQRSAGPGRSYPMTVLINGGSASASEILAAAVQQTVGGKLVGEPTFGKGTIQTQFDRQFTDGSMLKLTVARWLTPNGSWIDQNGLQPDIEIKQPDYFQVAPINREQQWAFGDLSEDVRNMQVMLQGLGYEPGRTDGYFGEETVSALKLFQERFNLTVTGKLDEPTVERLEDEIIQLLIMPENDLQLQEAIRLNTSN